MLLKELAKEFVFDCRVRELSDKTVKNYQKQVAYFIDYVEAQHDITALEQVSPAHIKGFISGYQLKGNKPSYINDLLKAVKCLFAYAYREEYTPKLLTERIKNVKEPKVLIHTFSEREIADLIHYFKGMDYLSIRNRVIMMVFFDTGTRVSELTQMRLEQIQDSYFIIHGKGRKERVVPKNPLVSKWLMKYLEIRKSYFEYRPAKDFVFLSKNGKPLTEEGIAKFMKAAARAVGVNPAVRVSPHTCRHTFAHQQLKNGLDLYSLSRLLGHENIAITQRYLEAIQDTQILMAARKTGVLANI